MTQARWTLGRAGYYLSPFGFLRVTRFGLRTLLSLLESHSMPRAIRWPETFSFNQAPGKRKNNSAFPLLLHLLIAFLGSSSVFSPLSYLKFTVGRLQKRKKCMRAHHRFGPHQKSARRALADTKMNPSSLWSAWVDLVFIQSTGILPLDQFSPPSLNQYSPWVERAIFCQWVLAPRAGEHPEVH